MSRLDGGQAASGKSFTRPIVKSLMQPLKLRDQEMKRIEQAYYQDLKKTSAKNKQLPEEPITDVRCLQTITKAKLVKRADMFIRKYGEPLTFWFYNEELATMTESNKRAFANSLPASKDYFFTIIQEPSLRPPSRTIIPFF